MATSLVGTPICPQDNLGKSLSILHFDDNIEVDDDNLWQAITDDPG